MKKIIPCIGVLAVVCATTIALGTGMKSKADEPVAYVPGDVNQNAIVDASDLDVIRGYLAGDEVLSDESLADITSDEETDIRDLIRFKKYMAQAEATGKVICGTNGAPSYQAVGASQTNWEMKAIEKNTTTETNMVSVEDGMGIGSDTTAYLTAGGAVTTPGSHDLAYVYTMPCKAKVDVALNTNLSFSDTDGVNVSCYRKTGDGKEILMETTRIVTASGTMKLTANDLVLNAGDTIYFRYDGNDARTDVGTFYGSVTYQKLCPTEEASTFEENSAATVWMPWTTDHYLPTTTGNYYLTADIPVCYTGDITSNQTIKVDLNGKTVSGQWRLYRAATTISGSLTQSTGVTLDIMDRTEEQNGAIVQTANYNGQGGMIWIEGGNNTFNLHSGTISAEGRVNERGGVVLYMPNRTSTFNMYGGTLIGGTSAGKESENLSFGGTLHMGGSFNMYGGIIRGGSSGAQGGNINLSGTGIMKMYGGVIDGGTAGTTGGNIHMASGSSLTLYGGTIRGGNSTGAGGNVFASGTVTVNGGEITDGVAGGQGGNVRADGNSTFAMTGGSVTGGKSTDAGGNFGIAGNLNITGGVISNGIADGKEDGTGAKPYSSSFFINQGSGKSIVLKNCAIDGGVYIYDTYAPIQMDDNTSIGWYRGSYGLGMGGNVKTRLGSNPLIVMDTVTDNGKTIAMDLSSFKGTTDTTNESLLLGRGVELADRAAVYDKKFDLGTKADLMYVNDKVKVIDYGLHVHCACGGDTGVAVADCGSGHEEIMYTKCEGITGNITTDQNLYLDQDLIIGTQYQVNVANGNTVNLCLNGHELERPSEHTSRIFVVGSDTKTGTLNIAAGCEHSTSQGVLRTNASAPNGSVVWLRSGAVRLYSLGMESLYPGQSTSDFWYAGSGNTVYMKNCTLRTTSSYVLQSWPSTGLTVEKVTP